MLRILRLLLPLGLLISLPACSSSDARVTRLAEQQAQQNQALAAQHQQIAQATRTLVEADQQARQQHAALALRLQDERAEVFEARDALETERQLIAQQRIRDPVVATAILNLGLLAACLLPLLVCLSVLRALASGQEDSHTLSEVLIAELFAEEPLLPPTHAPLRLGAAAKLPADLD